MKTWALIIIVVVLHCTAIGALFFIQGCGTTSSTQTAPSGVVMPPSEPPPSARVTPTKVTPEPVEKAKELDAKTYVVQPGDSVSKIAQRYNTSQAEILALNRLSDANKIGVGQKLLLPGYVDLARPVSRPSSVAPAPAVDSANVYVVQPRDSISGIAHRLNVSEDQIVELNNLTDRNKLLVGQKLIIPTTATAPVSDDSGVWESPVVVEESATMIRAVDKEGDAATGVAADKASISESVHWVQPGEDLSSIAKLYVVTVDEIARLNGLPRNARLKVGQRLRIP